MSDPVVTLLALDTSTEVVCLGLHGAHGTDVWEGPGGPQASLELLPRMQAMLDARGLCLADLDALAFGRGPGAFTGLRTACSVAQGVALGTGCPVIPVDSLMLVAEQARAAVQALEGPHAVLDIGVAMDARMGELYAARYGWSENEPGGWALRAPPALCSPEDVCACWGGWPTWLTGSGTALLGRAAAPALQPGSRAAALVRLGLRLQRAGAAVPAEQALPVYLRDKVALTTAQRAAAAALQAADPA